MTPTTERLSRSRITATSYEVRAHPAPEASAVRVVEGYLSAANGLIGRPRPDTRPYGVDSLYTSTARAALRGLAAFARAQGSEDWAKWVEDRVKQDEAEGAEVRKAVLALEAAAAPARAAARVKAAHKSTANEKESSSGG